MLAVARAARLGGGPARVAAVAVGANLLTHGTLWTVFGWLPGPYPARLVVAETAVFTTEAAVYAWRLGWSPRAAVALSFAANLVTTLVGLVRG